MLVFEIVIAGIGGESERHISEKKKILPSSIENNSYLHCWSLTKNYGVCVKITNNQSKISPIIMKILCAAVRYQILPSQDSKNYMGACWRKRRKKVWRRIRPGWEIFRCQVAVWVEDKQHFICTTTIYSLSMLFSKKEKIIFLYNIRRVSSLFFQYHS